MDLHLTPASTILYREFTGAGEEKCMLNSASANTVQGIQGACTTSPSFSKIQKCIHTLEKSRQSITGHSNWFIQNRPLPVQSERIPRYKLSLSSFIPGSDFIRRFHVPIFLIANLLRRKKLLRVAKQKFELGFVLNIKGLPSEVVLYDFNLSEVE